MALLPPPAPALGLLGRTIIFLLVLYAMYGLAIAVKYLRIWRTARDAGAPLGLADIVRLRYRKVDPYEIIEAYRLANLAELDLSIDDLERHHRHGGHIVAVVEALRMARQGRIRATWDALCRQDLSGENVVQAMKKRVEPPPGPRPPARSDT